MRCGQGVRRRAERPDFNCAANGVIVAHVRIFSRTPTGTTWPTCEKSSIPVGVVDTHAGPSTFAMVWTIAFGARWLLRLSIAREDEVASERGLSHEIRWCRGHLSAPVQQQHLGPWLNRSETPWFHGQQQLFFCAWPPLTVKLEASLPR